jgi:hypothetical protein
MPSTIGIVASGLSTPMELSPALWLDAADTTTITASGSPMRVSQWNDKSGNGYHLTQASSTPQPVSGASTVNGLNAIDFTSGRRLARPNVPVLQNIAGATSYVVVRGTYSSNFSTFCTITRDNSINLSRAALFGHAGTMRAGGRRLDADSFQSADSGAVVNNTAYQVGGLYDYANADLKIRVNGTSTTRSGGFQTAGNTSNTDSRVVVGANDNGTETYAGSICEVVVFSRVLTAAELDLLESYFSSKWGL